MVSRRPGANRRNLRMPPRVSAAAAAWTPMDPALQPQWWLRGDLGTTYSGSDLTAWANQGTTGSALDLTFDVSKYGAAGTAIGGQDTVAFGSSAYGYTSSTAALDVGEAVDLLVILIWRPTWASGRNQVLGNDGWDPSGSGDGWGYQPRTGGAARCGVSDGALALIDNGSSQSSGTVYVDAITLENLSTPSSDTLTLVQDGVGTGTTGLTGDCSSGGDVYTVGKGGSGSGSATLDLAELLVYVGSGVVASWRSTVESDFIDYLSDRYGLTRANVA